MSFAAILVETIPVFIIIGIGCLCRATKLVTESSEKTILGLVLNLLYPCFILSKICGNSALQELSTVGGGLAVGIVTTVTGLVVAYFAAQLFQIKTGQTRNTFTLSTAIQNYGFIPIPLIAGIFPKEIADETLGVMFIYILGLELVFWTIGVSIVSGSRKGAARRLVNGPSIAIVTGLILNFTQAYQWIPLPAEKAMEQLGLCSVPVSLLLVGVSLAGVMLQGNWLSCWRIPTAALLVRFAVMPILFLAAASLLSFSKPLMLVLIVEASMPAAIFPIVIAKHFGGKPTVAVQVSVFSSLACLILTPGILTLAFALFDVDMKPTALDKSNLNQPPAALQKPSDHHPAAYPQIGQHRVPGSDYPPA
jgi:predicted permease